MLQIWRPLQCTNIDMGVYCTLRTRGHTALLFIEAWTKWPPYCTWHFKRIFFNENFWILNKISLKNVPWVVIDDKSESDQVMAGYPTGDNPLTEVMLTKIYLPVTGLKFPIEINKFPIVYSLNLHKKKPRLCLTYSSLQSTCATKRHLRVEK